MKRGLSLILTLIMIIGIFANIPITVNAASTSNLTFKLSEDGNSYSVSACSEYASGSLTIPATYNGKPVTSIGSSAFEECTRLTSITIGNGVTSIGGYAFRSCTNLSSVIIGDNVTSIGQQAFYRCTSLESIEIPDSVTSIGWYAFYGCTSLSSITIPDSVTSIGIYAFYGCTSLTSITIPDSVTSIGYNAFDNTGYYNESANWLKGVLYINNHLIKAKTSVVAKDIIREGTITIAGEAFEDCIGLTTLIIPNSVASIGEDAFSDCTSLNAIYITDIAKWCCITFVYVTSNPLYYAKKLYLNNELVTDIDIPDSITSIGDRAFYNCTSLTSITIPDSVTSIGNSAFSGCTSLTSITIPDSVTSIGDYAFGLCRSLTSITIPASVVSIGERAFYGCTSLTSITIPDSVISIGYDAFSNCTSLGKVYWNAKNVPNFISSSDVFYNAGTSDSGIEVVFGDTVEKIPAYLFYVSNSSYRPKITSVTIGKNVTSIGGYAFYNCVGIKSITIPDSVTNIGSYAFSGCTSLKNVYYRGLLIDWGDIAVGDGNSCLLDTTFSHLCTYNDWIIDNIASCSETGLKHRTCLVCGETVTEEIPTISHTPSDWKIDTPATCVVSGSKHKECTVCGVTIETGIIPVTGHNLSDWIIDTQATAGAPGSKHKGCTECGEILETEVIPQLKPATPKAATTNEINGINITWNAVEGAVKYNVYRRVGGSSNWILIGHTTGTSLADTNVTNGTYYVYSVRAYNSAGSYSDFDTTKTVTIQPVTAPTAVATNLTNGVQVKWNASAGTTKYNVYRRIGGSSSWVLVGTTTGTSLVDKGVTNGKYYVYSIRAINSTGYSAFDTKKTDTIQPVTAPTAVATNLTNGVQVKWNASAGATKYNVYRRIGGSSSWVLVGTTTGTSLIDKGVTNGKYYVYSIRAINGTGYSAFDTKKTDTIQPITAPTAKVVNKSTGVQVSWNSVTGATKYNVYRRLAGTSTWIYVGTTTVTTLLDRGVVDGKTYSYSIRAINGTGYSAYNSSKCATIKHI